MVELLVILAVLGWIVVSIVELLSALPAFPTLVAASILVPTLAVVSHGNLLHAHGLEFLRTPRRFLPPERFYWPDQRRRLVRGMLDFLGIAGVAWPVAIAFPARFSVDPVSLTGWLSGSAAIVGTALAASRLAVFVCGSQRFDSFTPRIFGAFRRWMFRISDNYEFLGEEPEIPKKPVKESVY